ncbi:MAG: UV DNA damage repair endonuclease UvsE [candidate division WOR-3 bacterium]
MIRIGYPCINLSLKCRPGKTFRISSFNEKIFLEKAENNLKCLSEIIDFNIKNEIYFFRISSDIIPFASHPINKIKWEIIFKDLFREIGEKIKKNKIRVSMHPDQFVILNSPDKDVVKRSVDELIYHLKFLENLNTSSDAKIQIHIGGGYKDKKSSIERFLKNYEKLPLSLKERLVVENDERIYNLKDCLNLHEKAGIPIVADYLHHRLNNNGERFSEILKDVIKTWKIKDGPPIVDYSSLKLSGRKGSHAEKINLKDFYSFLKEVLKVTSCIDIMLEIKDKEKSALKAINFIKRKSLWKVQEYI